jgi:ABC-type uncharacterized transport system fused permease/ATPase subunit
MDKEMNHQIIQTALAEAKRHNLNMQLMMYLCALVVALITFCVLKKWMPAFVTMMDNGEKKFAQMRAILISVIVGLLVVLCYHALC